MAQDQKAIDQTDFTLPKNASIFSFDDERNLIKLSSIEGQAVSHIRPSIGPSVST